MLANPCLVRLAELRKNFIRSVGIWEVRDSEVRTAAPSLKASGITHHAHGLLQWLVELYIGTLFKSIYLCQALP